MAHTKYNLLMDLIRSLSNRKIEKNGMKLVRKTAAARSVFTTASDPKMPDVATSNEKIGILFISKFRCDCRSFQVESESV